MFFLPSCGGFFVEKGACAEMGIVVLLLTSVLMEQDTKSSTLGSTVLISAASGTTLLPLDSFNSFFSKYYRFVDFFLHARCDFSS